MKRLAVAALTLCWLLVSCAHPAGRAGTSPTPAVTTFAFGTQGHYAWALTGRGLELSDDAGGGWRLARGPVAPTRYLTAARWGAHEIWLAAAGRHATTLYRSADGGSHWTARTFAATAPDVRVTAALVSPSDGFLVLAEPETAITSVVRIYATSDGGATFQRRDAPQQTGPVEFTSPTHGVLVPSFADDEVYVTSDGARHWRESRLIGFPRHFTLGMPSADLGRLPVTLGRGEPAIAVASSSDGGRSYTLPRRRSLQVAGDGEVPAALAGGPDVWVVAPDGRRLYTSADRGRSWSASATSGLPGPVSELSMPSATRGLALVRSGTCRGVKTDCVQHSTLFVSDDGGRSWHPARL